MVVPVHELRLGTWLPSAGPLTLHFGGPGGWIAILTAAALTGVLALSRSEAPWSRELALVALAGANAAFLAGDFLTRYVALEVVGLAVGLAPLTVGDPAGMGRARRAYLWLRLGDAGLLIAILMLFEAAGTLAIEPALAAGEELPAARLVLVGVGFLLAVWIKLGAWPAHGWPNASNGASPALRTWLYGLAVPNLGLYLLYRTTPLVGHHQVLAPAAIGAGMLGLAVLLDGAVRGPLGSRKPIALNAVLGCAAVVLASAAGKTPVVWLAILATPVRLAVWAPEGEFAGEDADAQEGSSDAIAWLGRLARSVSHVVEKGVLEGLIAGLFRSLTGAADLAYRVVERDELGVWQRVTGVARRTQRLSHTDDADRLLESAAQSTLAISLWLQRRHTGRLRRNVAWFVISLAAVVVWVAGAAW